MFEKQRLYLGNIKEYTGSEESAFEYKIPHVPRLLQNDYGEACDCTLTSITAVIKFFRQDYNIQEIYNWVEKIAKAYGYRGDHGTYSLVIKTVYKKSLQGFGINEYKPKSYYLKDICYDYELIKSEIDNNKPILLNLWKDGRDFYKNHTVLIVGYYYLNNNQRFLMVQDNWYRTPSFIDYNLLSTISSVQTLT